MKNRCRYIALFFTFLVLFFLSCLCAVYIISIFEGHKILFGEAFRQASIAIVGVIIFVFFFLLRTMFSGLQDKHISDMHRHFHQAYYEFIGEIKIALDKISKGDFEVKIDKDKYEPREHWNKSFFELADKINDMANKLGAMETMRQDFVSDVSHEIRSPLTSIKGFVSLLKKDDLSRDDRLHYIEVVETEVLRLSDLVENMLRLSALEAGFCEPSLQSYSITGQIKDVILLLEPQWTKKNIDISLNDCEIGIVADKDMLNQVWINLLTNSVKFTTLGGAIDIALCDDSDNVQVVISDSGVGMTKDTLMHIFERFYVADKSRNKSVGGSGLGLSIVKKIVQLHGGEIDVESELGEGTRFKVTIPRRSSV